MYNQIEDLFANFFPDANARPFARLLMQRLREGHVCVPITDDDEKTPFSSVSKKTLKQVSEKLLSDKDAPVPFIYENGYLYLQRYYRYETQIVKHLQERLENSKANFDIYSERIAKQKDLILEQRDKKSLGNLKEDEKIDWQLIAVLRSLMNDFSIITGGPGTGKTRTLSKFLRILYATDPDSKVVLAAPTGKASMRMKESLLASSKEEKFPEQIIEKIEQLKPNTLHRLLGYVHNSIYFKHNDENTLSYDWVVVDEASMIDMPMFAKLLSACHSTTRILLLGDKDQLASVEAGSLLSDLCSSAGILNRFTSKQNNWLNGFIPDHERKIPENYSNENASFFSACITELRYSHRFQQRGEIGQLSLSIIRGEYERTFDLLKNPEQSEIKLVRQEDEESLVEFARGYIEFMEETDINYALKKLNKLRLLVTVREGKSGLYALNKKIESILYKIRPDLIRPAMGHYHNRPVIITKNNYELDLFNGDIGLVRMNQAANKLQVYFEPGKIGDPPRSFSPASISECETVFAMTIHKSQGSEFDHVMVVLPEQTDNKLLTRELIYTGVTRAKTTVVICGSEDCLQQGISRQVVRISGIHERIIKK